MGFKTQPRFKLVKEEVAGAMVMNKEEIVLTRSDMECLSNGLITFDIFDILVKGLDDDCL